jgi:hypothetical protein
MSGEIRIVGGGLRTRSARIAVALSMPSIAFVLGDWALSMVADTPANWMLFSIAGLSGLAVALVAPFATALAVVVVAAATLRGWCPASKLGWMWLSVALSVAAHIRLAAVLKRCCL